MVVVDLVLIKFLVLNVCIDVLLSCLVLVLSNWFYGLLM